MSSLLSNQFLSFPTLCLFVCVCLRVSVPNMNGLTSETRQQRRQPFVEDVPFSSADATDLPPEGTVHLRYENGLQVDRVVIHRHKGEPLGFSIYGGLGETCIPFGNNESGVFVSKVSSSAILTVLALLVVIDEDEYILNYCCSLF